MPHKKDQPSMFEASSAQALNLVRMLEETLPESLGLPEPQDPVKAMLTQMGIRSSDLRNTRGAS